MTQSRDDMLSRVRAMVKDDGGTWDLSPNDKAALRYVLRINDQVSLLSDFRNSVLDCVDKILGHFVEGNIEGNIRGEGAWRLREIHSAAQEILATNDRLFAAQEVEK